MFYLFLPFFKNTYLFVYFFFYKITSCVTYDTISERNDLKENDNSDTWIPPK